MTRQMYKPTEKQIEKWNKLSFTMPTDEQIKAEFAKKHHGKSTGWGMLKSEYTKTVLSQSAEYQLGCWQGKLDRANGLDYSEERNDNAYNLGYYRGYNENLAGYIADAKKSNPNFSHLAGTI